MDYDATYIGVFASGVWQNIGSPTSLAAGSISGWVTQDQTLGKLNNLIGSCYSGISGLVDPDIGREEQSILEQLFLVNFYRQEVQRVIGAGANLWVRIHEGDSDLSRANPSTLAEIYERMQKDAQDNLLTLVNLYNRNSQNANRPQSIDFYNIEAPRAKGTYYGRTFGYGV